MDAGTSHGCQGVRASKVLAVLDGTRKGLPHTPNRKRIEAAGTAERERSTAPELH